MLVVVYFRSCLPVYLLREVGVDGLALLLLLQIQLVYLVVELLVLLCDISVVIFDETRGQEQVGRGGLAVEVRDPVWIWIWL